MGIFNKLINGLKKTKTTLADKLKYVVSKNELDDEFFEELEYVLLSSDIDPETVDSIIEEMRERAKKALTKKSEDAKQILKEILVERLKDNDDNIEEYKFPLVIMVVGVNGVGKTTTIGKLATKYRQQGKSVLLAAADTFRAGATKQLQEWGERAGVPVVAGKEKADPASVVFEAVAKARDEHYDILFVDTAGRLQNNVNLMQELEKMKRIIQREIPDAPHEVLLVLDATTGQNALQQAKLFKDSSDVTGIVLTKMDGTAKGGIVFAIRSEMHLPVKWIGFGEKASDLRVFKPEEFIYSLFKDLIE